MTDDQILAFMRLKSDGIINKGINKKRKELFNQG